MEIEPYAREARDEGRDESDHEFPDCSFGCLHRWSNTKMALMLHEP